MLALVLWPIVLLTNFIGSGLVWFKHCVTVSKISGVNVITNIPYLAIIFGAFIDGLHVTAN